MTEATPGESEQERDERVLRSRARLLARPLAETAVATERFELLVVAVGHGRYALRLDDLGRVAPLPELCALPGAPPTVLGVAQIDGELLTVVDLARLLGEQGAATKTALVMRTFQGNFALAVSGYDGIEELRLGEPVALPVDPQAVQRHYVERVLPGGVGLLDVARLLRDLLVEESATPERSAT